MSPKKKNKKKPENKKQLYVPGFGEFSSRKSTACRVFFGDSVARSFAPHFASKLCIFWAKILHIPHQDPRPSFDTRLAEWHQSTMVENRKKHRFHSHLSHFPTREGVSKVSERANEWALSTVEGASEASSPEQANEWAVRADERTDERVTQYCSLYSWFFRPTAQSETRVTKPYDVWRKTYDLWRLTLDFEDVGRDTWPSMTELRISNIKLGNQHTVSIVWTRQYFKLYVSFKIYSLRSFFVVD